MIGLSLSLCIKDIMSGKVAEADVEKIISGTCCRTENDWEVLCTAYKELYWSAWDAATVVELLKRFRAQGKIVQPRLTNPEYFNSITDGWWVSKETVS